MASISAADVSCSWDVLGTSAVEDIIVSSSDRTKLCPPRAAPCVLSCPEKSRPLDIMLACPGQTVSSLAVRSSCKHIELYTASNKYIKTLIGRGVSELKFTGSCAVPTFATAWSGDGCEGGCKLRLVPSSKQDAEKTHTQAIQGILAHILPASHPAEAFTAGSSMKSAGSASSLPASAPPTAPQGVMPALAIIMSQLQQMDETMSTMQRSIERLELSMDRLHAKAGNSVLDADSVASS